MFQLLDSVNTTRVIRAAVFVLALLALPGCAPDAPTSLERFQARPHISAPPEYLECAHLVNRYVIATHAWEEQIFKVSFDGINLQFNAPRFRVSHIDDYKNYVEGMKGAGTSIFVVADCADMKIIKELKMQ